MTFSPQSKSRRAMTLVECMVGLLVFATGLLGVLGLIVFSTKTSVSSQAQDSGYQAIQAMIEQLRGKPYAVLAKSANGTSAPSSLSSRSSQSWNFSSKREDANALQGADKISGDGSLSEFGRLALNAQAGGNDGDQNKLFFSYFDPSSGVLQQALPVNSSKWTPLLGSYLSTPGTAAAKDAPPTVPLALDVALMVTPSSYLANGTSDGVAVEIHYRTPVAITGGGVRWVYGVSRTFVARTGNL